MSTFCMVHKRFATLIEVIIAMALVSVLMTILMGYYGQLEYLHAEIDQARDQGFQMRYLQTRLSFVLPRIVAVKAKEAERDRDFYFFTSSEQTASIQSPSLVFTFDNGIDLDPRFSNHVLARLLVEETEDNQRLMLLMWPVPRCWTKDELPPMKQEVLIDRVTDFEFSFYYPAYPDEVSAIAMEGLKKKPSSKDAKIAPNQWYTAWPIAYHDLPAVIKIRLKRSVQTGLTPPSEWIELDFPVPNAKSPIAVST